MSNENYSDRMTRRKHMENKELKNEDLENISGGFGLNARAAIYRCKACTETFSVPAPNLPGYTVQNVIDCTACNGKKTASFVRYIFL